jgi:hypothetical protein
MDEFSNKNPNFFYLLGQKNKVAAKKIRISLFRVVIYDKMVGSFSFKIFVWISKSKKSKQNVGVQSKIYSKKLSSQKQ